MDEFGIHFVANLGLLFFFLIWLFRNSTHQNSGLMLIVLGLLSLQNQPLQPNLKFVELLWKKEFPTLLSPPTVLLAISFLLWFSREFSLHRRRETKSPFSEMEISKVYIYIYLSLSIFSLNPWFIIILSQFLYNSLYYYCSCVQRRTWYWYFHH